MADNNQVDDWQDVPVDDWQDVPVDDWQDVPVDDWQDVPVDDWQDVSQPEKPGMLEAFGTGFAQGGYLGAYPKVEAATQILPTAAPGVFGERQPYETKKQQLYKRLGELQEQRPISYGAGEFAGSMIPTTMAATLSGPIGLAVNPKVRAGVKAAVMPFMSFAEGYQRETDPNILKKAEAGAKWAIADITGQAALQKAGRAIKRLAPKKATAALGKAKGKLYATFGVNKKLADKYRKILAGTREGKAIDRLDDLTDFVVKNEEAAKSLMKKDPADFLASLKEIRKRAGTDIGGFYKALSEQGVETFSPERLIESLQKEVIDTASKGTKTLNRKNLTMVDDLIKELRLASDINAIRGSGMIDPMDVRPGGFMSPETPVKPLRVPGAEDIQLSPEKAYTPTEAIDLLKDIDTKINFERLDPSANLKAIKRARSVARNTLYDALTENADAITVEKIKDLNKAYSTLAPIEKISENLYKVEKKLTKEGKDAIARNIPTQAWSINYMMNNKLPTVGSGILNKIFEPATPTKTLKQAAKHYQKYIKAVNWNRVNGGPYYKAVMDEAMQNLDDRLAAATFIGTHMALYNNNRQYRMYMDLLTKKGGKEKKKLPYTEIPKPKGTYSTL
jgi:hypothetical protein